MMIHDMTVVSDGAPTSHFGGIIAARELGDAAKDEAGMKTVVGVGRRVAEELARRGRPAAGKK